MKRLWLAVGILCSLSTHAQPWSGGESYMQGDLPPHQLAPIEQQAHTSAFADPWRAVDKLSGLDDMPKYKPLRDTTQDETLYGLPASPAPYPAPHPAPYPAPIGEHTDKWRMK